MRKLRRLMAVTLILLVVCSGALLAVPKGDNDGDVSKYHKHPVQKQEETTVTTPVTPATPQAVTMTPQSVTIVAPKVPAAGV